MTQEELQQLKDVIGGVFDDRISSLEEKQKLDIQENNRKLECLIKENSLELEKNLSKKISALEEKQELDIQKNSRKLEFLIKENSLELEEKQSKRLSALEEKQDMVSFRMKTDMEYLTMRTNSLGASTERAQRSPSGNALLEPKDSWSRRPLYNR